MRRLLSGIAVCFFAAPALAADWPQWRGPKRDGVSAETGLLKEWPEGGPKLAWKAETLLDGIRALTLMEDVRKKHRRKLLALAMGEEGVISRLLARKFAAPFTFATAESGQQSAPGQPTVHQLRTRYRWQTQDAATPVYGVIGWPVAHSLSPHIHNAGFDRANVPGVYLPLAIQPDAASFAAAVDALRAAMDLRGLSVTIPHKENAIRYVRERGGTVDELSSHIGVINTITFEPGGVIRGLNSDYAGAVDALTSAWNARREDVAGKRIAILGAGGAARAIVAALAHYGATVVIYNRTLEKAQALAAEFNGKTGIGMPTESFPTTVGGVSISNYNLFVRGGILSDEVRVRTTWSDYVFAKDYKLPSLKEVEEFIVANGHLMNVPSGKQVEAEGIEVGQMAKIQQEKIEELTLYVIQQQKEIEELRTIVNELITKNK